MVADYEVALARRDEIKSLVQDNDLTRAINRLLDYTCDFSKDKSTRNEAVATSFQYNRIRESQRKNLRTPSEIDTEVLRIVSSVLDLADRLFEDYSRAGENKFRPPHPAPATFPAVLAPDTPREPIPPDTPFDLARRQHKQKQSVAPQTVFECKGLTKRFTKSVDHFELSELSLALRPGEIIGVVGVNGAGKTTLLRIVAGELMATSGSYTYPLLATDSADWAAIRDQISYVSQSPMPWPGRLIDNLHVHAALHGLRGEENLSEVSFLIQRLGLDRFREAKWTEISGGYKMRFELAKALVARPKLLILDEPLAPLDIFSQQLFLRDLRNLADSTQNPLPIIVTSQHIYEIEAIADILLFLDGGKAIFCDAPAKIGYSRTANTYEMAFFSPPTVSAAILYKTLQHLADVRVEEHGLQFVVHTSRDVAAAEMFKVIAASGHNLQYFRDISSSSRIFFANIQEEL